MLKHNATMTCLLGRSGPWEFQVITPRHALLRGAERKRAGAGGSMRKTWKTVEVNWEPVEASGSQWKSWKTSGSGGRHVEDREGVGRGAGGPGEVREVRKAVGMCGRGRKAQEVTVRYTRQDHRRRGMAHSDKQERGAVLLGLHQFLLALYQGLLRTSAPTFQPIMERLHVALKRERTMALVFIKYSNSNLMSVVTLFFDVDV